MAEFIPQVPRSNSLKDRAIASIIDKINLHVVANKRGWIFKDFVVSWCKHLFWVDLTEEDIKYIQQNTNITIIDDRDIIIIDEEGD